VKSNACLVLLRISSLVCRFVYDLFVPNFPDIECFMYWTKILLGAKHILKCLGSQIVLLMASLVTSWM
jgi:hypothetical protein